MSVFLGNPPANVKRWIEEHYTPPTPPAREETVFWVDGVEQEPVLIEGALNQQWFIDHGYYDQDEYTWLKQITKAELGSKVTSIGNDTFSGCIGLTSINIPNSVTSIGYIAFSDCASLTSITIPSSVTSINSYIFDSCTSLTSITIPSSVTSIGDQAFSNCDNLATVYVDSDSEKERVRDLYDWPAAVQFEVKA